MLDDSILTNYRGCSRWTNSNRSMAVHIAPAYLGPLCGKQYSNGALDRDKFNLSEVTCQKCIKAYNNQK